MYSDITTAYNQKNINNLNTYRKAGMTFHVFPQNQDFWRIFDTKSVRLKIFFLFLQYI